MREVPRPEPLLADQGALWERERQPAGAVLQVARTYLVREIEGGLEIIDQHALHERVTYERLKRGLAAGRVEIQHELVPELIELSRSEVHTLEEHLAPLERLGIELAVFGPTTVAVHGLPAFFGHRAGVRLVRELVVSLGGGAALSEAGELLDHVVHGMACRRSVMAGDDLGPGEIRSLLEAAAELDHDQTCPHGRPTRVRFSTADLERAFHRR